MSGGGTRRAWRALIRTLRRSRRRRNRTPEIGPLGSGDPARSKRLGALLYLYRGGPPDPLAFRGELDTDELDALADLTEDDRHLANACLEVEAELLHRDFRRVERVLAADLFGDEEVDEALERGDVGRIAGELLALLELGLLD